MADTTTPIPNGAGNFRILGKVSVSQGNVAFIGIDQQFLPGIYARINGQLLNIADTLHPGPGGIHFDDFKSVSISGDSIAFVSGTQGAGNELWVLRQGAFSRVAASDTVLNGITIAGIQMGPEALKGDTVAFSFQDYGLPPVPIKGGVYTATYIPAPGALGLGAAAAFAAARRHRVHP